MENNCISDLDKAVADLNKNINELLSLLHQINIEVMKFKEKVLTGNMQTSINSQGTATKASDVSIPSDNSLKKGNNQG